MKVTDEVSFELFLLINQEVILLKTIMKTSNSIVNVIMAIC